MTAGPWRWSQVFPAGTRVLVIVNSDATQVGEIERAIAALDRSAGVRNIAVIAPSALKPWLIRRGVEAPAILAPRVAGLEVEFGDFLERPQAVEWAVQRRAAIVLATEPYPPRNEEAKFDLERRVAPMLGGARFAVHSLPLEDVLLFGAQELWNRAALEESKALHRARVSRALDQLHAHWSQAKPDAGHGDQQPDAIAASALGTDERPPDDASPRVAARQYALDRLWDALRAGADAEGMPKILVQPEGAVPRAGWLPGSIAAVRRPAQLGKGVRLHGTRLAIRGVVEGPYSYLVMSRPVNLNRGDAVMAAGRVYRGGITVGLVKGDAWASRVDVDAPGAFLAAAVAVEPGPHSLVVANCLKGDDRNTAVVLRRFGWARA